MGRGFFRGRRRCIVGRLFLDFDLIVFYGILVLLVFL